MFRGQARHGIGSGRRRSPWRHYWHCWSCHCRCWQREDHEIDGAHAECTSPSSAPQCGELAVFHCSWVAPGWSASALANTSSTCSARNGANKSNDSRGIGKQFFDHDLVFFMVRFNVGCTNRIKAFKFAPDKCGTDSVICDSKLQLPLARAHGL